MGLVPDKCSKKLFPNINKLFFVLFCFVFDHYEGIYQHI